MFKHRSMVDDIATCIRKRNAAAEVMLDDFRALRGDVDIDPIRMIATATAEIKILVCSGQ